MYSFVHRTARSQSFLAAGDVQEAVSSSWRGIVSKSWRKLRLGCGAERRLTHIRNIFPSVLHTWKPRRKEGRGNNENMRVRPSFRSLSRKQYCPRSSEKTVGKSHLTFPVVLCPFCARTNKGPIVRRRKDWNAARLVRKVAEAAAEEEKCCT